MIQVVEKEKNMIEMRELGALKHGRVKAPELMPINRQRHEHAMELSGRAWHVSESWLRDEDG